MSKKNLKSGRIQQKLKTRNIIINSAQELSSRKKKITLEDVADHSGLSRATVYRYFSNIDLLITEASLDIHHKSPEDLYKECKDMTLVDRLLYVQNYYNTLARDHETGFRRYLSIALKSSVNSRKKLRGARRPKSYVQIIEDYADKLNAEDQSRLTQIATLLSGIDAWLVCKDVNSMSHDEINKLLHWCLETLVRSVLDTSTEEKSTGR